MLLTNATIATMQGDQSYGIIASGALAFEGEAIVWVGHSNAVPKTYRALETLDCQGRLLTPGLIDCHTHIVHGGNRATEFEMRLNGASYEEVARAGGGIVSTVKANASGFAGRPGRVSLTTIGRPYR